MIIKVGSPAETFYVHKNVLCDESPFFRAALGGQFKESADGVVYLPEEKPETFERFINWLYCKEYYVEHVPNGKNDQGVWNTIICDHILADKLQVQAFQDHMFDKIIHAYKFKSLRTMSLDMVLKIYTKTGETSPLRRMAVDMYQCISGDWFQHSFVVGQLEKVPQFAAQLLIRLAGKGRIEREPSTLAAEEYYSHEEVLTLLYHVIRRTSCI